MKQLKAVSVPYTKIKKLFKELNLKIFTLILFLINCKTFAQTTIIANSVPKCGTHLLAKCLELLTGKHGANMSYMPWRTYDDFIEAGKIPTLKDNQFVFYHIPYTPQAHEGARRNSVKMVFIYRDPRDQIVSHALWLYQNPKNAPQEYARHLVDKKYLNNLFMQLIENVEDYYNKYLRWMNLPFVCSVKFEDLVGPQGGGSLQAQRVSIYKIAKFLGISISETKMSYILGNLFGDTPTFRKGKVGSWKNLFTTREKNYFTKKCGRILAGLGYEH